MTIPQSFQIQFISRSISSILVPGHSSGARRLLSTASRFCNPSPRTKNTSLRHCHGLAINRSFHNSRHPLTLFQTRALRTVTMAHSNAMEQLSKRTDGLSLDAIVDKYPGAHPEVNPYDLYRAHLSKVLSEISGVDTGIIFPVISWTQGLDRGDFIVAVPALRIKGQKPDVLASEWGAKVSDCKRCS